MAVFKILKYFILCCLLLSSLTAKEELLAFNEEIFALPELDLDTATYRVLTYSLPLQATNKEAYSKYYQAKQARSYPNPSLHYDVENFAGNREWKYWNHREEHFYYSQLIETAGKRRLRTEAFSYQYYASLVGYDVAKLQVLNRLNRAFIQVVSQQELLNIARDQADIAQEILRIATKKVEAGKASAIQQQKAAVSFSSALIEQKKACTDLKNAKKRLSLLWAQAHPDFGKVFFPFFDISPPLPLEERLSHLCCQPEIIQSFYHYLNKRKEWHLAKANRIPDITVQLGCKTNRGEKQEGLYAGISIPLPIFNRNEGNIGDAYFEMLQTADLSKELQLILETKLSILYEELLQAYEEAEKIKNTSLPHAQEAFELAQKGYREGKFEHLDVLDAQRTLFEIKERYIQALTHYHTKKGDIEYLNSQMD